MTLHVNPWVLYYTVIKRGETPGIFPGKCCCTLQYTVVNVITMIIMVQYNYVYIILWYISITGRIGH